MNHKKEQLDLAGKKDGGGVSTGKEERTAPASRELAAAARRGVPASRGVATVTALTEERVEERDGSWLH